MGILKRLFGQSKESTKNKKLLAQRAPRIDRRVFENIHFKMIDGDRAIPIEIINISSTGLALNGTQVQLNSDEFHGIIEVYNEPFAVSLLSVHQSDGVIGAKFTFVPETFQQTLHNYFRWQFLARSFVEVSADYLQQPKSGKAHWFVDGQNNEIYFVLNKNSIVEFHLAFGDHYIEGTTSKLRFGKLSSDKKEGLGIKATRIINFTEEYDQASIDDALKLINYVEHFSEIDFSALKSVLSRQ